VTAATTGSGNDQVLAKMLLVKAGNRSVPIVTRTLLADPRRHRPRRGAGQYRHRGSQEGTARALARPATTPDAATEALRTLDEIRRRGDDER
jgi:L-2-hydroxyglutarate oxidase LhgO